MHDDIKKIEASSFTKTIYLLGIAMVILSFLGKVPFALQLLMQMDRNPNVANPVIAIVSIISALGVLVFLGQRFINIARGRLKLSAIISNNKTLYVRNIGLALLSLGLTIALLTILSTFFVRGGGQVMVASYFSFAIPLGLVLFELSRMSEFENLNLTNDA